MLEFLGFIALISIAFGVSFGDAISGVFKFILFGVLGLIALGIVGKMLSSKRGSAFVAIASIVFVVLGVLMINDNYETRYSFCNGMTNASVYASCVLNANDGHVEAVNKGWAYAICGTIMAIVGGNAWGEIDEKERKLKEANKRVIDYKDDS